MLPNMDPRTMAKLMNQMGIKNTQIDATKVVIEKSDGTRLVVQNPQVVEISMQGQKTYQVSGDVSEDAKTGESSSDDAELVALQAHVSKEQAAQALDKAGGDIAEAILLLEQEEDRK